MDRLRSRIRGWTLFFICGLFISGATALPIRTEVAVGARILGEDFGASGSLPPEVAAWLRVVRDAVETTASQAPLMFYGTDWLGVVGFVPMWLCNRWVSQLEAAE
jgi:hypothetical protein